MRSVLDEAYQPVDRRGARRLLRLAGAALGMVWTSARREFVWVAASAVLLGVGAATLVLLTSQVVGGLAGAGGDLSVPPHLLAGLLAMVAIIAGLALVTAVQRERERVVGELVAWHALARLLEVSSRVPLESFERPDFYDRLQRAHVSAEQRPLQLASGLIATIGAAAGSIGVTAGLFLISPLLAGMVLLAVVPLWLAASYSSRVLYAFSYRMTPGDRERVYLNNLASDKESAAEVRAFALAPFLRRRFDELFATRIAGTRKVARQRLRAAVAGGLGSSAVIMLVLVAAGALVNRGTLSLAEAGAAVVAIGMLSQRLSAASDGVASLHESTLFVEDFVTFVEPEYARLVEHPPASRTGRFGRIDAAGLRFRYPRSERDALRGVDLTLHAGEVVALVGENGSGKTTLAKLLAGLYQPTEGQIRWDDRAVSPEDAVGVRDQVALALQDYVRYRFTAAENIAIGRHDRPYELADVRAAAARARADEFIGHLPDGYDTRLGTQFLGGFDLSGGQWQRLALARTFFRDAPLIILDEPTASLDPRAERDLFDDIRNLCSGRTVLLISHRFANVRSADRIYVLDRGEIIESGNHDDLMSAGGRYAELFNLQAAGYLGTPERSGDRNTANPNGAPWHSTPVT